MKLSKGICIRCILGNATQCSDKALVDSWLDTFNYYWDNGYVYRYLGQCHLVRVFDALVSHDDVISGRRIDCPYIAEHAVMADE